MSPERQGKNVHSSHVRDRQSRTGQVHGRRMRKPYCAWTTEHPLRDKEDTQHGRVSQTMISGRSQTQMTTLRGSIYLKLENRANMVSGDGGQNSGVLGGKQLDRGEGPEGPWGGCSIS